MAQKCRIVSKCRKHQKTRAHKGSERRFAPVLAIICHHRFPGFHFLFCCYTGVRGFESSLSTPSQAVRLRSLHRLPKSRRPIRGFKLGGHAPAVIHISVRLRLTRTFVVTHANAWGLRPYTRTLAVARANVRPNGLTRGAHNGAPTSDLSNIYTHAAITSSCGPTARRRPQPSHRSGTRPEGHRNKTISSHRQYHT